MARNPEETKQKLNADKMHQKFILFSSNKEKILAKQIFTYSRIYFCVRILSWDFNLDVGIFKFCVGGCNITLMHTSQSLKQQLYNIMFLFQSILHARLTSTIETYLRT